MYGTASRTAIVIAVRPLIPRATALLRSLTLSHLALSHLTLALRLAVILPLAVGLGTGTSLAPLLSDLEVIQVDSFDLVELSIIVHVRGDGHPTLGLKLDLPIARLAILGTAL